MPPASQAIPPPSRRFQKRTLPPFRDRAPKEKSSRAATRARETEPSTATEFPSPEFRWTYPFAPIPWRPSRQPPPSEHPSDAPGRQDKPPARPSPPTTAASSRSPLRET